MSSSSQMYSFEPLQLRRFSGISLPGLEIAREHELEDADMAPSISRPHGAEKAPPPSTTTAVTTLARSDDGSGSDDAASDSIAPCYTPSATDSHVRKSYLYPRPPPPTPTPTTSTAADVQVLRTSLLQHKRQRFLSTWIVAVLSAIVSSLSVWYSWRVMVDRTALPANMALSPGVTVLVANILSHIVAYLCWSLASDTMEALRWALACRPEGVLLTSFLALSRATPLVGVVYLCSVRGQHWLWAVQRILSFLFIALLGLVLISDVTFQTLYTPFSDEDNATNATQEVVAGLAPVSSNGLENITLSVVNLFASYSMGFITDPRFVATIAPIACSGRDCLSIFLPGGMDSVRFDDDIGYKSLFSGDFPGDYSTIVVNDAPGYQLEYASIASVDAAFQFDLEKDCTRYLESIEDGLLICMKERGMQLFLGWTVCPPATRFFGQCSKDLSWTTSVLWNTTLSMYSRLAKVAYDSQNISILGIVSITPPTAVPVPVSEFARWCDIVLAPVPSALNMTANGTEFQISATNFDIEFSIGFLLRLYESDYATYLDGGLSLLRSFIAVPFQFSTALQQQTGGIAQLPAANHVTASLSKSTYRAIVNPWTVLVFGLLAVTLTVWSTAWLAWISFYAPHSPNASLFPEIDITSKSSVHTFSVREAYSSDGTLPAGRRQTLEMADETLEDLVKLTRKHGLGNGMSRAVVRAICGKRVYCGSCPGPEDGENFIVLVAEKGQVKLLNLHEKYA